MDKKIFEKKNNILIINNKTDTNSNIFKEILFSLEELSNKDNKNQYYIYKNLKEKILRTNLNESFIKEAFDKIEKKIKKIEEKEENIEQEIEKNIKEIFPES